MGIFLMFFAIGFGMRGDFLERTAGALERLSAGWPTSPATSLAGYAVALFAFASLRARRSLVTP